MYAQYVLAHKRETYRDRTTPIAATIIDFRTANSAQRFPIYTHSHMYVPNEHIRVRAAVCMCAR